MSQDFAEFTWPDKAAMCSSSGFAYKNLSGPLFLSVDVTNRCNFRCKHCFNNSGDSTTHHNFSDEITDAELISLIPQIVDLKPYSVCICGGEPLLRFSILPEFISGLAAHNIQISMVSNGYLLTQEMAQTLFAAGLTMTQISVDGADAETHDTFRNMPGSFEKAKAALRNLKKAGIRTAVSFAPNHTNIKKFPQYVQLIQSLNCDEIRMMPFIPMGRGLGNFETLEATTDEYMEFKLFLAENKEEIRKKGTSIMWGDPLEHIYLAVHAREYPVMMEIRSNGDIGVSEYLPFRVGNIRNHTLREYWDGGYNRIWGFPEIRPLADKVKNLYDFELNELMTWNIDFMSFDLLDSRKCDKEGES